jgi:hypothetical protein
MSAQTKKATPNATMRTANVSQNLISQAMACQKRRFDFGGCPEGGLSACHCAHAGRRAMVCPPSPSRDIPEL